MDHDIDKWIFIKPVPVHEMCAKMSEPTALEGTREWWDAEIVSAQQLMDDTDAFLTREWFNANLAPIPAGDAPPVWPPGVALGDLAEAVASAEPGDTIHVSMPDGAYEIPPAITSKPWPNFNSRPTVPGSIPNPYTSIDTKPEPTEKQKALWDAIRAVSRA